VQVNKVTRDLFATYRSPSDYADAPPEEFAQAIRRIGLYRNKAKNIILLSQLLMSRHGGVVPSDRDALVQLPGVGRKTANVVLNMAFGEKTMAVDTHVFRVSHRLGLAKGKTPEDVEEELLKIIPEKYLYHAHHWLILHGRYTCLARQPKCVACPIADLCTSSDKSV
jgi:endonuclease-3